MIICKTKVWNLLFFPLRVPFSCVHSFHPPILLLNVSHLPLFYVPLLLLLHLWSFLCCLSPHSYYFTHFPSSSPPSLPPLITECEGIDNRLLPYVAPWLMFSGLSRCFSFIAHVMAHKLIPKRDLPDDFHSKKGGQEKETLTGKDTDT